MFSMKVELVALLGVSCVIMLFYYISCSVIADSDPL
jgi:hypothetical protein